MVARGSRPGLQQTLHLVICLWFGLRVPVLSKLLVSIMQGPRRPRTEETGGPCWLIEGFVKLQKWNKIQCRLYIKDIKKFKDFDDFD